MVIRVIRIISGVKVSRTHHDGNMFYFQMPQHIHFFSRVTNGLEMIVSALIHLLGRVKMSDLVQSGRDRRDSSIGHLASL